MLNSRWFSVIVGGSLVAVLMAVLFSATPMLALAQGGGMMAPSRGAGVTGQGNFGPGWMMQNSQGFSGTIPYGPGSMMGHFFSGEAGVAGMMGGGMWGNTNNAFYIAPPRLSVAEARTALNDYVASLNDPNLKVVDIMIFDNHAYAQIIEQDSGIGVQEVLVDPVTKFVYPEMGPTMMWNQKYGMMTGFNQFGMMGMMGGGRFFPGSSANPAVATITPEQAVSTAQSYLDTNYAELNLAVLDHVSPFYGYYTLHVQQDGQTVGMLGVNSFTGAVWPHTWHGKFLEVSME